MKLTQKNNLVSRPKRSLYRYLQLMFIPCEINQYRPYLIRRYGLLAVFIFVIAIQTLNFPTAKATSGSPELIVVDTLLSDTNNERTHRQLSPLKVNEKLSRAAFLKGQDMIKQQYWAHAAPDGSTPWKWLKSVNYGYRYAGENLAKNFHTADAVTAAWMASPEHQANILDRHYVEVGFASVSGVLDGKLTTLVVALYGTPSQAPGMAAGTWRETNAPIRQPVSLMTRVGVALQSMSPIVIGSIIILIASVCVVFTAHAHAHRYKSSKSRYRSWYRNHGLVKAGGMVSLCFIIVFLYSGG